MYLYRFVRLLAAGLMGFVVACTADETPHRVSLVTFNALVAEHGPHLDERLTAIGDAVNDLQPDILCLQEVWLLEHVERLVKTVKPTLPYAYFTVREGSASTSCQSSERDSLVACVEEHCDGMSNDELPSCAVRSCASEFAAVSRGCQECVLSNADGAESLQDVVLACSEGSDRAAYERQNGLVLLSAFPFREKSNVSLTSRVFERGVLHAELDVGFDSRLDVFCTHLAATLDLDTDPEDDTTAERSQQIAEVLDFIDEERSNENTSVLLGDVNCGPAGDRVESADVEDFEQLTSGDLRTPYDRAPFCTWCTENNLVADTDDSQMIDHVFFSELPENQRTTIRRVFDEPSTLDVDGDEISSALSDHYGLQITVSN